MILPGQVRDRLGIGWPQESLKLGEVSRSAEAPLYFLKLFSLTNLAGRPKGISFLRQTIACLDPVEIP